MKNNDCTPNAVFPHPLVFADRALSPIAVLLYPSVFEERVLYQTAVLEYVPGTRDQRLQLPKAVFVRTFPLPCPTVMPFTRISLHEKLAIILLLVAPE